MRSLLCQFALVLGLPLTIVGQTLPTFSVSITQPSELVEEVGTTRRVGRAEIEARNARTLDEALRLLPGVNVRTAGDGTPRIDVRGFRSRHVLLLINGVFVNSTADGQFDPARIPTETIREIKVSYGSSSLLYGDNALAAVIEITTVDAQEDATVDMSGGSPDQKTIAGRYARTVGKWSIMGSATRFVSDGFRLPDSFTPTPLEDGGRRENSDRDRGDLRGAVGYRFSPRVSLASEWSFGTGSYGIPPSTIGDPADIFALTPRFERVNDYRTASGQISLAASPWSRLHLRMWAYLHQQREDRARYDDETYSSMDDPLVQGTFESRERTTVTGSSALGRFDLSGWGWLRVAVNQRREAFDAAGAIRDVTTAGTTGGGGGGGARSGGDGRPTPFEVRAFSIDRHVDVYSSGAEWQVRPARRMGTVVGATVNAQQRPDGATVPEPSWIVGITYDTSAALRLHASATRKVRVPSIDQLFNTSAGNPDLRAERAYGFDIGLDQRLGIASTLTVSAFNTNAHDFIERTSGRPSENHDEYRFRGAEVTAETTRIPTLELRGGYSFLDSVDLTDPLNIRRLQTRPRHRLSMQWIWRPKTTFALRGAAYRSGAQLHDSRGGDSVQQAANGFTLVDLGVTQTIARRYDVAVDVSNLLDRLYDQAYGLPREGRAVVLTLRARLH
jgi:vitamin B12 transporter